MPLAPKVSICIPVYNAEKFIGATLQSALAQTFADCEILLVDNCSTDRSMEIVKSFSDNRIRVLSNATNIGAEANWNRALKEARGTYLKLLCADDLLAPTCIEKQVAVLDLDAHVALTCCQRLVITEDGKRLMTRKGLGSVNASLDREQVIRRIVRAGTNLIGEPCAVLFRADLLRVTGFFNGRLPYMIDVDFWCRLLSAGSLYVLSEPLCSFRISRGSWSAALAREQGRQAIAFIADLKRQNPKFVNELDFFMGQLRARIMSVLRQILYFFHA